MNWVDIVLIALLLTAVIVGSKKGLVREIMAFLMFFCAIILSVVYIDSFAVWIYEKVGGSPLVAAFVAFTVLIALSYATFKLAAIVFYKVANIKGMGKQDQIGGALVGFLRGWLLVGFAVFLLFLLPLPASFYTSFEQSFFGPTIAKTIPLVFNGTSPVHPASNDFVGKIENTLLQAQSVNQDTSNEDRMAVYEALHNIRRFFTLGDGSKS